MKNTERNCKDISWVREKVKTDYIHIGIKNCICYEKEFTSQQTKSHKSWTVTTWLEKPKGYTASS